MAACRILSLTSPPRDWDQEEQECRHQHRSKKTPACDHTSQKMLVRQKDLLLIPTLAFVKRLCRTMKQATQCLLPNASFTAKAEHSRFLLATPQQEIGKSGNAKSRIQRCLAQDTQTRDSRLSDLKHIKPLKGVPRPGLPGHASVCEGPKGLPESKREPSVPCANSLLRSAVGNDHFCDTTKGPRKD